MKESDRNHDHHQYLLRYPNGTVLINPQTMIRYRVGVHNDAPAIFKMDVHGCSAGRPLGTTTTKWLRLPRRNEEFATLKQAIEFVALLADRPDLIELNSIEMSSDFGDDRKALIWTVIFMPIDPGLVEQHADRIRGFKKALKGDERQ